MTAELVGLASALEGIGLDKRYALDVGSVLAGIRPRGLLHVKAELRTPLLAIIAQHGLVIEFERPLHRRVDKNTREGLLSDTGIAGVHSESWVEVWYRNSPVPEVPGHVLVGNPGLHLGYPACCVLSMVRKDSIASHYASYIFAEHRDRLWELNRLAALFSKYLLVPDFFPCSLSCGNAADFVRPFRELARMVWNERDCLEAVDAARQPIFLWGKFLVAFPDYSATTSKLTVNVASARKVELSEVGIDRDYVSPVLLRFRHLAGALPGDQGRFEAVEDGTLLFERQIEWA